VNPPTRRIKLNLRSLLKKEFDVCQILGLNMGSLLRIPRARLLSGTERLGSLKERKGHRECWATVEPSKKRMDSIAKQSTPLCVSMERGINAREHEIR
jgi:hypothetical protein